MSHSTLHVSPFGGVSYNEIEKPGFEEILKNVSLSADFNQNMYACLKLTNDIMYVVAASYSIIFMSFDSILFCGKKTGWCEIGTSHKQTRVLTNRLSENLAH